MELVVKGGTVHAGTHTPDRRTHTRTHRHILTHSRMHTYRKAVATPTNQRLKREGERTRVLRVDVCALLQQVLDHAVIAPQGSGAQGCRAICGRRGGTMPP